MCAVNEQWPALMVLLLHRPGSKRLPVCTSCLQAASAFVSLHASCHLCVIMNGKYKLAVKSTSRLQCTHATRQMKSRRGSREVSERTLHRTHQTLEGEGAHVGAGQG